MTEFADRTQATLTWSPRPNGVMPKPSRFCIAATWTGSTTSWRYGWRAVDAAQDATQTIFLRVLTALPQCRDEEHFAGWLFAIARNVVIDSYRSQRQIQVDLEAVPELVDRAESPESLAMRADDARTLREARDRCLAGIERELLDLRLQDLTSQEIAIAMKRSQTASAICSSA